MATVDASANSEPTTGVSAKRLGAIVGRGILGMILTGRDLGSGMVEYARRCK
jgi:hypothetical protein